jgi:hypothetical protein
MALEELDIAQGSAGTPLVILTVETILQEVLRNFLTL